MSTLSGLRGLGILNEVSNYADLVTRVRREVRAYCSSNQCCGYELRVRYKRKDGTYGYRLQQKWKDKVLKGTNLKRDTCIDCGYALFHKQVTKNKDDYEGKKL